VKRAADPVGVLGAEASRAHVEADDGLIAAMRKPAGGPLAVRGETGMPRAELGLKIRVADDGLAPVLANDIRDLRDVAEEDDLAIRGEGNPPPFETTTSTLSPYPRQTTADLVFRLDQHLSSRVDERAVARRRIASPSSTTSRSAPVGAATTASTPRG